jgi:hypothetical protein
MHSGKSAPSNVISALMTIVITRGRTLQVLILIVVLVVLSY